jgi:hypothetical protein
MSSQPTGLLAVRWQPRGSRRFYFLRRLHLRKPLCALLALESCLTLNAVACAFSGNGLHYDQLHRFAFALLAENSISPLRLSECRNAMLRFCSLPCSLCSLRGSEIQERHRKRAVHAVPRRRLQRARFRQRSQLRMVGSPAFVSCSFCFVLSHSRF